MRLKGAKETNKSLFLLVGCIGLLVITLLLGSAFEKAPLKVVENEIQLLTELTPVEIIVKEKHFDKLWRKKNEAVSRGVLVGSEDDYVPATLVFNKEEYNVDLRLKGDWTDHLEGLKWSYRIKVKDGKTILGMRKFSLQHPKTRYYLNEWIFHKALLKENVIALRYGFTNGILSVQNNTGESLDRKDLGIYAYEESFDKRLIENNGRKESVIFKFNEDYLWKEWASSFEIVKKIGRDKAERIKYEQGDFPMEATAFSLPNIFEDENLTVLFHHGKNMLYDYGHHKKKVSDFFDVEKVAAYTAISNVMGATHGLAQHNLRFYYNPISSKMEPIGFDSGAGSKLLRLIHFWRAKEDSLYLSALILQLEKVTADGYLEELIQANQKELNFLTEQLRLEFNDLSNLDMDLLKSNQEVLKMELEILKNSLYQ